MQGQLTEMQGSGTQTNQLISLYGKQLEQLTKEANETHELATQAKTQAENTVALAKAATRSATAAEQANKTAKDALHISERAERHPDF